MRLAVMSASHSVRVGIFMDEHQRTIGLAVPGFMEKRRFHPDAYSGRDESGRFNS
jgi:hypothetical protein